MEYTFSTKLWEWTGEGAWIFITLPAEYYEEIKQIANSSNKGFGSIRVEAKIRDTSWNTSIFPDSKTKTYLLPIKKEIRTAENIAVGDLVEVSLKIIDL
jgi:Domain of unknown function (DUF1905)